MRSRAIPSWLLPLLLFVGVFLVHNNSRNAVLTDSFWSVHVALSILGERNTDIDEYLKTCATPETYRLATVNGRQYSFFPIAPAVLSLPIVALLDGLSPFLWGYDLEDTLRRKPHWSASSQRLIASLYTALAALFVLLTARRACGRDSVALAAACIFAFGTSAWSVASRVLWQHGPSMAAVAATLYLLETGKRDTRRVPLVGLTLALAYVLRPVNCAAVVVFAGYVLWRHPRQVLACVLWSLPVIVPFFAHSLLLYGNPLPPYYAASRLDFDLPRVLLGMAGNLFSPSRGLFVFSPVLLFALYGGVLKAREGRFDALDAAIPVACLLQLVIVSSTHDWYGGHCYGPRYTSDMLPLLVYWLIPVLDRLSARPGFAAPGRMALGALFAAFLLVSVLIHYRGANCPGTWDWNQVPADINDAPARLWDWRDAQFLAPCTSKLP